MTSFAGWEKDKIVRSLLSDDSGWVKRVVKSGWNQFQTWTTVFARTTPGKVSRIFLAWFFLIAAEGVNQKFVGLPE